jgi:hypothetical protein
MTSPPTRWKFNCIVRPRRAKYQHGSCQTSVKTFVDVGSTYLSELPPIQKVTGIIFEDKNEVDLVFVPHTTSKSEAYHEKVNKEKASVYLPRLDLHTLSQHASVPVVDSWFQQLGQDHLGGMNRLYWTP